MPQGLSEASYFSPLTLNLGMDMLSYTKKAMWQGRQSRPGARGPHPPRELRWLSQWQEELVRLGSRAGSDITHW